jgi:hypothetical protein
MKTSIPELLNPLKHGGTNRFERLPVEMDFNYVQIEERHEADFLRYAATLASSIQYYNSENIPAGNWKSFFDETTPTDRPHKALFIAFLRLLEALNEHANGLTKRHLDYYYEEVLQFVRREAQPDTVHLVFTCANTLKERFIEKNATLSAGETAEGQPIVFRLVDEMVVNRATITQLYAVFQHSQAFGSRLFSADNTSLLTAGDEEKPFGFPAFGEHQLRYKKTAGIYETPEIRSVATQTMNPAALGCAFASPLLRMSEGARTITIRLMLERPLNELFLPNDFQFSITTADGWYRFPDGMVAVSKQEQSEIILRLTLNNTDPAISDYAMNIHSGNYETAHPVVRILFNHDSPQFAYSKWKNVQVKKGFLAVAASNVRSLIIQNDVAVLDASKPFRPFGPIPTVNSHFYVGHPYVFSNRLKTAAIGINWKDLPTDNLGNHYQAYQAHPTNADFKVRIAVLQDKEWLEETSAVSLFEANAKSKRTIPFDFSHIQRKPNSGPVAEWNYDTSHGFLRLTLSNPDTSNFQAFGHSVYNKELMRANAANPALGIEQPYTPVIESLTLNYETEEVQFSIEPVDRFFHIEPFGQLEQPILPALQLTPLFPEFVNEGELYIGLKEVNAPQSVSFLFQFAEGTGDADQSKIDSGIKWFYLSGNEWKPIDKLRISKDTTRNLLHTGILRFDLPNDVDSTHTLMPSGLYWLKAVISEKTAGIDSVRMIHTQAVETIEVDPAGDPAGIAPLTITKLDNGGKGIAEIKQPAASFGGKKADTEAVFYARIGERLRHKDRGVMIWDYERLVLDAFPDLYKVKCLNHTDYQTEIVAGNVMVAVVPNLRNKGLHSPFQPKLSLHRRMDIYDFLRERISPFIYLRVENPVYEPLQLSFNVGFHKGYDEGFYGKKLHQELQQFLSPWAFAAEIDERNDLVFGGELHKSVVLKFIEDREYVDFVNDFNLYHIYQDPRIEERFVAEIANSSNYYSSANAFEACWIIKMAFQAADLNELTSLIEVKVRFLNGIIDEDLPKKLIKQLYTSLTNKVKKGIPVTKNSIRILIKNMFYVDKIVSLSFHKILPDGFVMEDVDTAVAKTSRSVMVTAEQHRIGVYRAGDYKCEGSVVIGIGFMIVEADFIIPELKEENHEYKTR